MTDIMEHLSTKDIIITSRLVQETNISALLPQTKNEIKLELKGIPEGQWDIFIKNYLDVINPDMKGYIKHKNKSAVELIRLINGYPREIKEMLKLPMNMALVTYLYAAEDNFETLSEAQLLQKLILFSEQKLFDRIQSREDFFFHDRIQIEQSIKRIKSKIEEMAFETLLRGEIILSDERYEKLNEFVKSTDPNLPTGDIIGTYLSRKKSDLSQSQHSFYSFTHKTLQEYMAAEFIVKKKEKNKLQEMIKKTNLSSEWRPFYNCMRILLQVIVSKEKKDENLDILMGNIYTLAFKNGRIRISDVNRFLKNISHNTIVIEKISKCIDDLEIDSEELEITNSLLKFRVPNTIKINIRKEMKLSEDLLTLLKNISHEECEGGLDCDHLAVQEGNEDIVAPLHARGLPVDKQNRTLLGLAVWLGNTSFVNTLLQEKVSLSEGDKDWHKIGSEDTGLTILKIIEKTGVCPLDSCSSDGFTLLHLAARNGYQNLMDRLLKLKINPNLGNNKRETPLFEAIKSNHPDCVRQLIGAGAKRSMVHNILHMAVEYGDVKVIEFLLPISTSEHEDIDINQIDQSNYTAIYYAIRTSRYEFLQRFIEYSHFKKRPVKITENETLLEFYTERNNLGQYDNIVVRVLECEKQIHHSKEAAEECLRDQLGTTESSTKATDQLKSMYELTKTQRKCRIFLLFLLCFLLPSILFYLDVGTDIRLVCVYYNDAYPKYNIRRLNELMNCNNQTVIDDAEVMGDLDGANFTAVNCNMTFPYNEEQIPIKEKNFIMESQGKTNFVLTLVFILLPIPFFCMWNFYIHVTQPNNMPFFRERHKVFRVLVYALAFLTPFAPLMANIENFHVQMKYMNKTARSSQEPDSESNKSFRKNCDLKHEAQMRVAITNVMEASLESAFQLILQLYIVGTQYNDLKMMSKDTLLKQVFSVLMSLVSLIWSFTSYHRFSKLGGLTIPKALPLLFAILFQVVSRAIACTLFTLAYKWWIFTVLGVHFILVFVLKLILEERSPLTDKQNYCCQCLLRTLRSIFYVFLGTLASIFVYFRLERPSAEKKQRSRQPTGKIQVFFLVLVFVENFILLAIGIGGLDQEIYDSKFIIVSVAICSLSYIIGVVLHIVYYKFFGHPWADINGSNLTGDLAHYIPCCPLSHQTQDQDPTVVYIPARRDTETSDGPLVRSDIQSHWP